MWQTLSPPCRIWRKDVEPVFSSRPLLRPFPGFLDRKFHKENIFKLKIDANENADSIHLLKSADNWNVLQNSLVLSCRNKGISIIKSTRSCYNSCHKWCLLSCFITSCHLFYYCTACSPVCDKKVPLRDALVSIMKLGWYVEVWLILVTRTHQSTVNKHRGRKF